MVHKMQRLALNNTSSMEVDEGHKCTTIEEEVEGEEEGTWCSGCFKLSNFIFMAVEMDYTMLYSCHQWTCIQLTAIFDMFNVFSLIMIEFALVEMSCCFALTLLMH